MQRLVSLVLIGGLVWLFMTNRLSLGMLDPRPVGIEIDGNTIIRTSDDVEARFSRIGSYDDTLMLFGGVSLPLRNAVQHAHLSGMPIRDARELARHTPDFHLCGRPGSDQAKGRTESFDFIASDRMTRATLEDALAEFRDAVRSGGERPCLELKGTSLQLDSIDVPGQKKGLATDAIRAFGRSRFVLVEEARLHRCGTLLR